jgi:hypothetical protein
MLPWHISSAPVGHHPLPAPRIDTCEEVDACLLEKACTIDWDLTSSTFMLGASHLPADIFSPSRQDVISHLQCA